LDSVYSPVVVSGRLNTSHGIGRAWPSVAIAIFFLETAMTLRPDGGDTRAEAGIACRFICGPQRLHDVNQVIRFAQYAHALSV
jgi:hypothetical protein